MESTAWTLLIRELWTDEPTYEPAMLEEVQSGPNENLSWFKMDPCVVLQKEPSCSVHLVRCKPLANSRTCGYVNVVSCLI